MLAVPNDLNIGRIAGIAQKHLRVAAEISAPAVDLVNLISGHQSGRTGLRDLRRQVRYAVYPKHLRAAEQNCDNQQSGNEIHKSTGGQNHQLF